MASSKTIGGINVTISATTEKFEKAIAKTRKTLASFSQSVLSLKGLTGALAGYATARGLAHIATDTYRAIDAFGELSDKLGVGTDKLKGLQLAAEEAGVSAQTFERAMVKLNKEGLGGEGGLRQWIEDTARLSTHQERLAATTKMFGSRGSDMVRMLEGGTAALDEAQQAAEKFGWSMDRAAVKKVEQAMDAFGRLKMAFGGFVGSLAVATADIAKFTAGALAELTRGIIALVDSFKALGYWSDWGWEKVIKGGVWLAGMNVRERIPTLNLPTKPAAGPGPNAMRGFGENGRIVGGKGTFSWGRGFGSDSAGRFAASTGGKIDTNSTINQLLDMAIMSMPIANRRQGLLSRIAGNFGRAMSQFGGGQLQQFNNPVMRTLLKFWSSTVGLGGGAAASAAAAGRSRGSLAFAESGSVDAYRQQAAIRKQNEGINLDKKRNDLLRGIKDALGNGPVLMAANFGGR